MQLEEDLCIEGQEATQVGTIQDLQLLGRSAASAQLLPFVLVEAAAVAAAGSTVAAVIDAVVDSDVVVVVVAEMEVQG